MIKQKVSLFKS